MSTTITLNIKTKKDTSLFLSAEDLKQKYLFGVSIRKDGEEMSDATYDFWIKAAIKQIEDYLTIKLAPEIVFENKDFHYDDWIQWNMIKTSYPLMAAISLEGYIGTIKQVTYPRLWLSTRHSTDEHYSRLLYVVPNTDSTYTQAAQIYTGVLPNIGWMGGSRQTPNYWTIKYLTGFKKLPADIEMAIGMIASINILTVGNETLAAALGLGVGSKSISLDGLSQSTSLYINGQYGIFGARIKQYTELLSGKDGEGGLLKRLQDSYGAFIWTTA